MVRIKRVFVVHVAQNLCSYLLDLAARRYRPVKHAAEVFTYSFLAPPSLSGLSHSAFQLGNP